MTELLDADNMDVSDEKSEERSEEEAEKEQNPGGFDDAMVPLRSFIETFQRGEHYGLADEQLFEVSTLLELGAKAIRDGIERRRERKSIAKPVVRDEKKQKKTRLATNSVRFVCQCGRDFSTQGSLDRHAAKHGTRRFKCERIGCGKKFFRLDLLHKHIQTVHEKKKKKKNKHKT
jgi:hypothetical protein